MAERVGEIYGIRLIGDVSFVYVGQAAVTAEHRFKQHVSSALRGVDFLLYRWMRAVGTENVECVVLETNLSSQAARNEREIFFIRTLNTYHAENHSACNLTRGGDGSSGRRQTDKTRQKIREKAIGREVSAQTRAKQSVLRRGRPLGPHSAATKQKIGEANRGKKRTPEVIEATRKRNTGRKHTQEARDKISASHATRSGNQSLVAKRVTHTRWHTNRSIVNLECIFCTATSESDIT